MIIIKVELRCVIKEYLPNLAIERVAVDVDFKTEFLKCLGRGLPKFQKTMFAREAIGLQENLVLAVMNYVVG
jgi:hypothetical protein